MTSSTCNGYSTGGDGGRVPATSGEPRTAGSTSRGIWTVNTVGFAGQGARYTLAIMNHLGGEAGFRAGANTLTQVAAILFQGRQIPVPDVSATP